MPPRLSARICAALRGDDGTATVEAAFGIASIVAVVVLVLGGVAACFSQLQLEAAVREAARVAAVEGVAAGDAAGRARAPAGAEFTVSGGETVTAVAGYSPGGIPGLSLRAEAVVRAEPGVAAAEAGP